LSDELLNLLESLERDDRTKVREHDITRAPFGYPGGKSKTAKFILPHLPYREVYVEPFGGSGVILLSRDACDLEVYNDKYGGVVCFYRVLRDPKLYNQLLDRLTLVLHSREEFDWCKHTWEEAQDPVERAARWYYMLRTSFGQIGRNFGRSLKTSMIARKYVNGLQSFPEIHQRLRLVQVENQDWLQCMRDYDGPETVFYCDPPYMHTTDGIYVEKFDISEHKRLLDYIHNECQGFVALSAYQSQLYQSYPWDRYEQFKSFVSMKGQSFQESNKGDHKLSDEEATNRDSADEFLWIKEAEHLRN